MKPHMERWRELRPAADELITLIVASKLPPDESYLLALAAAGHFIGLATSIKMMGGDKAMPSTWLRPFLEEMMKDIDNHRDALLQQVIPPNKH